MLQKKDETRAGRDVPGTSPTHFPPASYSHTLSDPTASAPLGGDVEERSSIKDLTRHAQLAASSSCPQ